ncbi:DOT1-domain-containing protein [Laetiporus sulphureus 93-53]|uniref:Histone-lysine N-methyltransferase, H3 lysine-79 specific n=1 Tax=Laetiporus sulphureus 93-53 TaxID=1314785 RepID=A0A165FGC1_9APHY|nr:DOT1-domain-containing protein [Laetiporus sulphureus 93-53]KZT08928.1 DOT1-domain-containing protein [Laetiporus sulphureus 93-53]
MINSDFRDPDDSDNRSFEVHPTIYPSVELEYPNSGASEKFALLVPKDKDHYNPIMCLENTLHTIYKHYLTPIQQSWFGTLPSSNLADDDIPGPASLTEAALEASTALFPPPSALSVASSPASSSSDSSTDSSSSASSNSSATSITSVSSVSSIASLSSITNLSHHAIQISPTAAPTVNYLRLLQRAINKRDGPLFIKVMEAINALLRLLKYPPLPPDPFESPPPNCFPDVVKSWTNIPKEVVTRIVDETYQRAVGPHVAELKRYEAFSSEVYGELMPALVSQIINETGLGPDSLFVDLGSGVGNVVLQASLQTGCKSFGIEIMPTPAKIARSQLEQIRIRCRMWGVKMGEVELEEGDMLTSRKVDELVPQADVVLVNNKVFLEPLNEALRPKFLDLKEGAIVVSLKPFVSSSRLTERNLDDISAIFQVKERPYYAGSVSWGNGGGSYYFHRVDREGYADIKKRFENSRTTPARTTRSRR